MQCVALQDFRNGTGTVGVVTIHGIPDHLPILLNGKTFLPVRSRLTDSWGAVQVLILGIEDEGWIQVDAKEVREVSGAIF